MVIFVLLSSFFKSIMAYKYLLFILFVNCRPFINEFNSAILISWQNSESLIKCKFAIAKYILYIIKWGMDSYFLSFYYVLHVHVWDFLPEKENGILWFLSWLSNIHLLNWNVPFLFRNNYEFTCSFRCIFLDYSKVW